MSSHVAVARLQFTLTVTFLHHLFVVFTMGLALFACLETAAYFRARPVTDG